MNHRTKNEHYVPQCYLKLFANEAEQLWFYDKIENRTCGPTHVKNLAQERDFNEYSATKDPSDQKNYQFVEKGLAPIEDSACRRIQAIVQAAIAAPDGQKIITPAVKRNLACWVALQYLRTKEGREYTREFLNKAHTAMMRATACELSLDVDLESLRAEVSEDEVTYQHLRSTLENARELTDLFDSKIWIATVHEDRGNLWTSDHPVVLDMGQEPHQAVDGGLGHPKVIVRYPLSPKVMLQLFEQSGFPELLSNDCTSKGLRMEGVRRSNELQLGQCYRHVYSQVNDMQTAEELCRQQPGFRNTNRERLGVEGLGSDEWAKSMQDAEKSKNIEDDRQDESNQE